MRCHHRPLSVITAVLAVVPIPHAKCGEIPRQNQVEAARRQDPTGRGTFHRSGMLREQETARARAAQAAPATPEPATEPGKAKKKRFFLWRWLFGA